MTKLPLTLLAAATLLYGTDAAAHCQIPCGIYGDHARVDAMREDAQTIAKSVKLINQLAKKRDAQSQNQLVRWVNNKEQHAEKIMRTIADYFMAQKIKPPAAKDQKSHKPYMDQLARHHAVMVAAMKCKQTASDKAVKELQRAIEGIAGYWKK